MPRTYAGVGSRSTPFGGCAECTRAARRLAAAGWTLRTGGAPGADQAFEAGTSRTDTVEVYLPWRSFEADRPFAHAARLTRPSAAAYEVAERHHPAWGRLSPGVHALLARNAHVVLGEHLDDPVDLVVCWWQRGSGGTAHAIAVATEAGVEVVNLAWGTRRLEEALDGA